MGFSTRRRDSMIMTLSKRLDRASGVISFSVVVASIVTAMVASVFLIIPGMSEEETLRETLKERQVRSEELKSAVRVMDDRLLALDDPYGVYRIAVDNYGYKPKAEPTG